MLAIPLLLAGALVPVWFAPCWMPGDYRWLRQSVSETGGQGVPRAVWTRLGLAAYGAAALLLAIRLVTAGRAFGWGLVPFGLAMLAAARWSHRHWDPAVAVDARADRRHSLAAQSAGIAFTLTAGAALAWGPGGGWTLAAMLAAILAPFALALVPAIGGLAQRLMFLVAALWLATLAV